MTHTPSSRPEPRGTSRGGVERPLYSPLHVSQQPTTPPQPNFDRVARLYRWAEYLTLGPLLVRARNRFLPQLPACKRALVLGDGDGRFVANLLQHQPNLQALAVDTSATMLYLLRQRCIQNISRLQTLQASALTIMPAHNTDLVVTHFFLDCLTQPEVDTLTQRLAAQLPAGALWLVSDFGQPHPRVLRPLAALYIRALYLAFRILTGLRVTHLPNPQAALQAAGFDRIARHELLCGLIYTEIWQHR
jgi:ubiquinone/menaquinone biosynthesis C-methylase UbiE